MLKKNIIASQLFFKLKGQCQCLPLYAFYMQRDSHQFKRHAFWNNSANFVSFWFLYIAHRRLFLRRRDLPYRIILTHYYTVGLVFFSETSACDIAYVTEKLSSKQVFLLKE